MIWIRKCPVHDHYSDLRTEFEAFFRNDFGKIIDSYKNRNSDFYLFSILIKIFAGKTRISPVILHRKSDLTGSGSN